MDSKRTPTSKVVAISAVFLLILMAVLAGGAMRRESVTFDEVAHIAAGVTALQKLDLRLNEEHPPLAKVIAAVPLAIRGTKVDYSSPGWSFSGSGFFKQYLGQWVVGNWLLAKWNDPFSTLFWARVPMLLITLLMGFLLYWYGAKFSSPLGGLLCLCTFATMPAFLTFGPLVLTDTAVTLFSLLALWTFADMWQSPSRETVVKFGFALGGAILTKFSAGLLFFCFLAFILSLRWRQVEGMPSEKSELRAWRRKRWWSLIKGTLLAAFVVYAVYLILSWNQPTDSFSVIPHFPASPVLRRLLMPPWIFLRGLLTFLATSSRGAFILGKSYPHGEWFYFPILFFLKSPLAFLGLLFLASAAAVAVKRRIAQPALVARGMEFHWRAVWTFLVVLTAACMLSRITISIRHFFVPLSLLILLLAPLPSALESLRRSGWGPARFGSWATAALALALVVNAVSTYPNFMPFLNSLSLGRPAFELVADSNLDWNQALPGAELWVQKHGLEHILLDEYGTFDPTTYVPQATLWNCQQPSAADAGQWTLVSASMILDGHNCRWLLQYPHESIAAGSMYAFRLPAVIPQAGTPAGPPLRSDWHNLGGMPGEIDFRQVFIDVVRDPQQLQPTWDRMSAMMQEEIKKQQQARKRTQ